LISEYGSRVDVSALLVDVVVLLVDVAVLLVDVVFEVVVISLVELVEDFTEDVDVLLLLLLLPPTTPPGPFKFEIPVFCNVVGSNG
jgi:hypothetical protein